MVEILTRKGERAVVLDFSNYTLIYAAHNNQLFLLLNSPYCYVCRVSRVVQCSRSLFTGVMPKNNTFVNRPFPVAKLKTNLFF